MAGSDPELPTALSDRPAVAAPPAANEAPHPRRWMVLFAMTGSLAMILLDVTVVGVARPTIASALGLDPSASLWVMNAYTLTMASLIALCGRVTDSVGRVRAFIGGMLLFTLASAICGMAEGAWSIIGGRALQGLGAALMQPASSAIVIGSFAPGERGKAMGVYVGIPMLFLTLGPVVGGVLSEYVSWRACFYINLPIAAAAIWLTMVVRPNGGPRLRDPVSPVSVLLYLVGLPALVLGIQQGPTWGWETPSVWVPIVVGTLAIAFFVVTERERRYPLIALRLFDDRRFLGAALVLFCSQFAMTGQVVFMGDYFQQELGMTQARAGAALLPMMLPTLFIVHIAGRMYDKRGPRMPILAGTALASLGLVVQAIATPSHVYLPIAVGMVVFGLGIGLLMSPANTDALSRAGPERRGQASGLLGTTRQVAASNGIAIIGAAVASWGTAAGQWSAALSFAFAFVAAWFLITGGSLSAEANS